MQGITPPPGSHKVCNPCHDPLTSLDGCMRELVVCLCLSCAAPAYQQGTIIIIRVKRPSCRSAAQASGILFSVFLLFSANFHPLIQVVIVE